MSASPSAEPRRRRIFYVIPGLGAGGGAERSLVSMLPFWTAHLDVHVIVNSARLDLAPAVTASRARISRLEESGILGQAAELRRLIATEQPDLVHTTLWEADVIGRLAAIATRTPTSSSLVNVNYGREHLPPGRFASQRMLRAQVVDMTTAQFVAGFHALTSHVATTMSRRLQISPSRITVIPRGRDGTLLGEATPRRRQETRLRFNVGRRPLLLAAARHERQKGLDDLIRALPRVLRSFPDALLLLGGREGAESALLRQLVDDLGLQSSVSFIGQRADLADLMCAADVLCVPSRWEGFGSILVEAMAIGVPTVTYAIPPIVEVAGTPPCFWLVPPQDEDALSEGIVRMLTDRELAMALASLARHRFHGGFTAELVAGRMIDFFEQTVSRSRVRKQELSPFGNQFGE